MTTEPKWITSAVLVGVDLGKFQDYTAISIVFEQKRAHWNPVFKDTPEPIRYQLKYIDRLPLETGYQQQVNHVSQMMAGLTGKCQIKPVLLVDVGGVGAAVADMFRSSGLKPIEIQFTGGDKVTHRKHGFNVPKKDLVSAIQKTIGNSELQIPAGLPLADVLITEAVRMEVKQSSAGNLQYSHREGEHDDLVFSLALPLWYSWHTRKKQIRAVPSLWGR
jgi:hypothetical protein